MVYFITWKIVSLLTAFILGFSAAYVDILFRKIPNFIPVIIIYIGIILRIAIFLIVPIPAKQIVYSCAFSIFFFAILYIMWQRDLLGGGDVKLCFALSLIVLPSVNMQIVFILNCLICGGVLAIIYLFFKWVLFYVECITLTKFRYSKFFKWIKLEKYRFSKNTGIPYTVSLFVGSAVSIIQTKPSMFW